jgi:copper chaperone CopZ
MQRSLTCATLAMLLAGCSGGEPQASATKAAASQQTRQVAYTVTGMHCGGCAEAITAEVAAVKGVNSVHCTFESKCAVVELSNPASQADAERAITKLGYTIEPCAVPAAIPTQPAGAVSSK